MRSTIGQKTLMALSGLFLCLFLTIHLLGNLQLFLPPDQAQRQFNWYAQFLSRQPAITAAAFLTYLAIVGHTVLSLILARRNRHAVGVGYQGPPPTGLSPWYRRMMLSLGGIILLFLVVHLNDFWRPFKFGADIGLDDEGRRDLYGLVVRELSVGWKAGLYVLGVVAVGFHLLHGFYSGFRSLGLSHPGYAKWLRRLSYVFAAAITVGFAAMPVYIWLSR